MQVGLGQKTLEQVMTRLVSVIVICSSMLVVVLGQVQNVNAQAAQVVGETPGQLQQLVAPIALYPDELVAQVLTAAEYPYEISEANRWLGMHPGLPNQQLATEVDQQAWDPSVKALTAFPSVVANMDVNLPWTVELGRAYSSQPRNVLDAVQVMRRRAEDAGNLRSTPQQNVTTEGSSIVIEPVVADTCYLPYYDPWIVYGGPIAAYPGYVYGAWYGPPYISFGPAVRIGFFGGFGWGWPAWGFNWNRGVVVFNRGPVFPRNSIFFHGYGGGYSVGPGFRSGSGFYRSGGRGGAFGGFGRGGFGGFGHHR
jgi:Protein of unknown function (DUF3300)